VYFLGRNTVKVAYIFATDMASTFKLGTMILPQLERKDHGAQVVGMMFFDDNIFCLRSGDPVGERLARIAKQNGILLMVCDQCAVRRGLAEGTFDECGTGSVKAKGMVEGVVCGCFPQLYAALASNPPDQVITL
jgi:sulfur relay (sulfurtransferase) complex TusBCD TusD component (DsrE family)